MTSWSVIYIVFTGLTSCNSILSGFASLGVLFLIVRYHRHTKSVPILLAAYTSAAIFVASVLLANIAIVSLFGFLNIRLPDHADTVWCHWCTFLFRSALCALFDSYVLQAVFRSFRVILYQKKYLHSFSLYTRLIPCSIIVSLVSVSPLLLHGDISYLSDTYYCDLSIANLPMFGYFVARIYFFPLCFIFMAYIVLLRHVRRIRQLSAGGRNARHRLKHSNRDLGVLKRTLLSLVVLIFFGMPGFAVLTYFYITGRLFALVYHLTWACVSSGAFFLCYLLVMFTKPLRDTAKSLMHHSPTRAQDAELLPTPVWLQSTGIAQQNKSVRNGVTPFRWRDISERYFDICIFLLTCYLVDHLKLNLNSSQATPYSNR